MLMVVVHDHQPPVLPDEPEPWAPVRVRCGGRRKVELALAERSGRSRILLGAGRALHRPQEIEHA